MRAAYLDVDGIRTRYLHEGTGPAVVLLHGVGLSADTWLRNIDVLAGKYSIYAPDMVGHGYTDPVPFGNDAPHKAIVEHIVAFTEKLGLDSFVIVGSSFGAQIAALTYFAVPDRVKKLVIIGSGACFNTEAEQLETFPRVYQNAMSALADPTLANFRKRMANLCYDAKSVPEEILLGQLTSAARPGMVDAYKATIDGMLNLDKARPYRIMERVESIRVPTLLIWGRQDTRGKYEHAVAASTRIPDCRLETFEECGHVPYIEYPDRFNDVMLRFLG